MKKGPQLVICFFLLFFTIRIAKGQNKIEYSIVDIDGYYLREVSYDSNFKNYHYQRIFFEALNKHYSILENINYLNRTCKVNDLFLKKVASRPIIDCLKGYYYFAKRDTSHYDQIKIPDLYGDFYEDENKKTYLGYKMTAKVLIIPKSCAEYEKSAVYNTLCGNRFQMPYIHILNIKSSRKLNAADLKRMKYTKSNIKKINLIDCS